MSDKKIDKGYLSGVMDTLFLLGKCGKTMEEYVFGPISICLCDDAIVLDYGNYSDRVRYESIEAVRRDKDGLFFVFNNNIHFMKL